MKMFYGIKFLTKCDECGFVMNRVKKYGPNDYGCEECGHPVELEWLLENQGAP